MVGLHPQRPLCVAPVVALCCALVPLCRVRAHVHQCMHTCAAIRDIYSYTVIYHAVPAVRFVYHAHTAAVCPQLANSGARKLLV